MPGSGRWRPKLAWCSIHWQALRWRPWRLVVDGAANRAPALDRLLCATVVRRVSKVCLMALVY